MRILISKIWSVMLLNFDIDGQTIENAIYEVSKKISEFFLENEIKKINDLVLKIIKKTGVDIFYHVRRVTDWESFDSDANILEELRKHFTIDKMFMMLVLSELFEDAYFVKSAKNTIEHIEIDTPCLLIPIDSWNRSFSIVIS